MTELRPTCDECGQKPGSDGFTIDPVSMGVLCMVCRYPDEEERKRVLSAALRASIGWFKLEFGRLPRSSTELLEYLNGGELPEMGKGSVYVGPDQGGAFKPN